MPSYGIVDTHLHLWDTAYLRYPWLNRIPSLNRAFVLADFYGASTGVRVEKIVFLQAECLQSQYREEVAWVSQLAREEPRIHGIVAWAPVEHGEAACTDLAVLASNPLVKGIRRILSEDAPEFWLQPSFVRGVQALAQFGLTFDLTVSHSQLLAARQLVRQCPDVSFILDHIGNPDIAAGRFQPWASDLAALAELPNVCCKVSGVATRADCQHWTREQLKPYIDEVLACFGFEHAMFGSDWPVATQAIAYVQWVEVLEWAVAGCSDQELRRLFHDNAIAFYRL